MLIRRGIVLLIALVAILSGVANGKSQQPRSRKGGKQKEKRARKKDPPRARVSAAGTFLLQSSQDRWKCFAGDGLRRCGSDTMWYQTSTSLSSYSNMHLRSSPDSTSSSDLCLVRKSCIEGDNVEAASDLSLGSCSDPCSAMKWSIEKDVINDLPVVVFNDLTARTQLCLHANVSTNRAGLSPCTEKFSTFFQMKVLKPQIQRMNSTAQKLVDAAIDDDSTAVKELLSSKKVDVNARDWEDATVLHAAASRGDVELVDYIVKSQQADVNLFDSSHRSALMDAAQRGHRQVVEILVTAGAEIDSVNIAGSTPLMMAAEKGFVSVVEFLLEQSSVDVNRQDSMGATALIRACQQAPDTDGLVASIGALLQAGADVNLGSYGVGGDKPVALTHALDVAITSDDQLQVVKLLLDHKTSLRGEQGEGEDSSSSSSSSSSDDENSGNVNDDVNFGLLSAAWNGKTRLAEMLLAAGADVDHTDGTTNVTALMYAAANGHESIVKSLLDRGADAKRIHSTGGTALFESCINGTSALNFNLLMNAGADPFVTDSDNVTCLMAAAESGNVEIVTALLRAGLLINGVSAAGATPLMHAANANKSDIVRLFADHKADVDVAVNATPAYIAKNRVDFEMGTVNELYEHGLTALMMASKMAFLPIVKILVQAGAQIHLADAQQQTAVVHAARNSSFALDVVTFLVEKGADPNAMIWDKLNGDKSLLLHAVVNNQTDLAMLLLQKGANASFSDEDGVTVATHAAFLGNLRVVRDLISRNADIASANFEGTDPLIAASAEGHVEIVAELLKSKRVNIHNKDVDGTNALMAASVRGHKEVAKLLVSAGVNVNAQNSEGHTALMFAFNGKHQVELLLEKYREYQKSVEDNSTALLRNALAVHTSIIQLLRRSGADAKLTDNWGHEASDFDKVRLGSTEASGDAASEEL